MKYKRLLAFLVGIVVIAAAGTWFYMSSTASALVNEKDLMPAVRVDYPQIINSSGLLEAKSSVPVGCPQVGNARRFKLVRVVDEGTQVAEGDFLMEFDGSDFSRSLRDASTRYQSEQERYQQRRSSRENQVRDNKLNLEQARSDLDKLNNKLNQQAELESALTIAQTKIQRDMAVMKVESLEKQVQLQDESSRLDMQISRSNEGNFKRQMEDLLDTIDSLTVRAPVAGVVIYRRDYNNEPKPVIGNDANPMDPLLEIPDLSTMRVKVLVDEIDAGKVKVGQKTRIIVPALQGMTFDGKVIELSAILKQADFSRAQKVAEARVELDLGQDLTLLRPGMSATVQIQVGIIPQAIVIPLASIQERNGGSFVQVLTPDKKAFEWRAIELQTNDELSAVVKSGLEANEMIRSKPKM